MVHGTNFEIFYRCGGVAYEPTPMVAHPAAGEEQVTSLFFWGTHSGVGGGKASETAAGATALRFVVEEMCTRRLKLAFNSAFIPPYYAIAPHVVPRNNSTWSKTARAMGGRQVRLISSGRELHWSAVHRYQKVPAWRPPALSHLHEAIMNTDISKFVNQQHLFLKMWWLPVMWCDVMWCIFGH